MNIEDAMKTEDTRTYDQTKVMKFDHYHISEK